LPEKLLLAWVGSICTEVATGPLASPRDAHAKFASERKRSQRRSAEALLALQFGHPAAMENALRVKRAARYQPQVHHDA